MRFTHLHAHSTYSFLDGYGTPRQIADRLDEIGHRACAITDHGNVVGHVPIFKEYKKRGIKTVLGCEFYICDDATVKGPHCLSLGTPAGRSRGPLPHITVLAKTQQGYENLLALSIFSYMDGSYYRPRIDLKHLVEKQEGLIVLSGCPGGYLSRYLHKSMTASSLVSSDGITPEEWQSRCETVEAEYRAKAVDFVKYMKSRVENFYLEITPSPGYDVSEMVSSEIFCLGRDHQIPVVVTADAHFPKPEHHEAQETLLCVGLGCTVSDPNREIKLPDYQYYCTGEELLVRAKAVCPNIPENVLIQSIENSARISNGCEAEIPTAKPVAFPSLPINTSPKELLAQWIEDGLYTKLERGKISDQDVERYRARALNELEVLDGKKFVEYILSVVDLVQHMRRQGALVMLRGSANGCLILWLTGCSWTDPLKFGLSFERFYDASRPDAPDVDIDIEEARRPEALEYIFSQYGRDNCSQIAGYSKLKAKGALQDVCRALGIPRSEFGEYSNMLEDTSEDHEVITIAAPLIEKYPRLGRVLPLVMGQVRQTTVHAAGILISSEPLARAVGLMMSSQGNAVATVDKKGAVDMGFLKLDLLNVKGLDVIARAARSVNRAIGRCEDNLEWLEDIELDDPKVLKMASDGYLAGVFQLDGVSAYKTAGAIGIDTFDDLVAASVLCRPGSSDYVGEYAANKTDLNRLNKYLDSINPVAAEIVRPTFGVLMFQEQVMDLAHRVAGLTLSEAQKLRKELSDKLALIPEVGDEWRATRSKQFMDSCMANGLTEEEAFYWWNFVELHGGYSFNKSHGVGYGVVGYLMLYMKLYHPAAHYEAAVSIAAKHTLKKRLLLEFRDRGGNIVPLHHEHSKANFSIVGSNTLVGGYSDFKGIGPKIAERLVSKKFGSTEEMFAAIPKTVRERMVECGLPNPSGENNSVLIDLAPWIPIPFVPEEDSQKVFDIGARMVGQVDAMEEGNSYVGGYVTSTEFTPERVWFTLEDSDGCRTCRVSSKKLHDLGDYFRQLKVGQFIALRGWIFDKVIYVKDFDLL